VQVASCCRVKKLPRLPLVVRLRLLPQRPLPRLPLRLVTE